MNETPGRDELEEDPPPEIPPLAGFINNYVLLLYAVSCLLIYLSVSVIIFLKGLTVISLIVPSLLGIILPLYTLTRRFYIPFRREFKLKRPDPLLTAIILLIAAGSILPTNMITWLIEGKNPVDPDYIEFLISIKPKGFFSFLGILAGTVIISPFGEELLFRGFIQQVFHRNMPASAAIILSGLVFGASHFNLPHLLSLIILGVILGYIFYMTGNLLYPFFAHAFFNLVSLIDLNMTSKEVILLGERETPSISWTIISAAACAAGILLLRRQNGSENKEDNDRPLPPSS
ncbi:MAG: CPBP family intramembrane metalloprotease [Candidatus Krumholzibacteriota bacterium]|nr:CPBP family intramembrane metalloprotease [Candidatus Krumholzibacteriota bacterium]